MANQHRNAVWHLICDGYQHQHRGVTLASLCVDDKMVIMAA